MSGGAALLGSVVGLSLFWPVILGFIKPDPTWISKVNKICRETYSDLRHIIQKIQDQLDQGSSLPGVDFIKVGRTAQIKEIALSICALRLCPDFEKLFTGAKVLRKGKGHKKVYEIDPRRGQPFWQKGQNLEQKILAGQNTRRLLKWVTHYKMDLAL